MLKFGENFVVKKGRGDGGGEKGGMFINFDELWGQSEINITVIISWCSGTLVTCDLK